MAAKKKSAAERTEQLTLRIPESVKKRLNAHCAFRQRSEERTVSYNQALLDLIQAAPVR